MVLFGVNLSQQCYNAAYGFNFYNSSTSFKFYNKSYWIMDLKNVIFDVGGVLIDLHPDRSIAAFGEIGCRQIKQYIEEHRTEDLFLDIELGRISTHEFCNEVRRICSADCGNDNMDSKMGDSDIVGAWCRMIGHFDNAKRKLFDELKSRGVRLFMLSNTNEMHWECCLREFADSHGGCATDCMDGVFLSHEMHLAKPDPGIFREVLRRTGISPSQTLFIDDSQENCRAAESLGISTLHAAPGADWTVTLKDYTR